MGSYGPMAIHVGGTGEVRLKNVCYKDLLRRSVPREYPRPTIQIQRLESIIFHGLRRLQM